MSVIKNKTNDALNRAYSWESTHSLPRATPIDFANNKNLLADLGGEWKKTISCLRTHLCPTGSKLLPLLRRFISSRIARFVVGPVPALSSLSFRGTLMAMANVAGKVSLAIGPSG